jgi:hypothetical protein
VVSRARKGTCRLTIKEKLLEIIEIKVLFSLGQKDQLTRSSFMGKKQISKRLMVFLKAGLPYTIAGMIIVFLGLYAVKYLFRESEYLSLMQLAWLAVFWFIYQPLFKRRIDRIKHELKRS